MSQQTTERNVSPAEAEGNLWYGAILAVVLGVAAVLVFGAPAEPTGPHEREAPSGERAAESPAPVATGPEGAVATASPEASRAGIAVLEQGGNAFDAFVAASFAVSVTRPHSTGIGGGGFVVWHEAAGDTQGIVDGREEAPSGAHRDVYLDPDTGEVLPRASLDGPGAAGVPGLVAMLEAIWREHESGALTWEEVLAPAIRLAEEGFTVREGLAHATRARRDVLARYRASRRLFLPGGRPLQVGDTLRQPELAETLEAIAEHGARAFYTGPVARAIVRSKEDWISEEDLRGYLDHGVRTDREPIRGDYRGLRVVSMPPPSSGGVHLVQMLNIMSGYDLGRLGWQSPDHLHVLIESMRRAYADRSKHLGDTDFVDVPVAGLTSPDYAAQLREEIDLERATPSGEVEAGEPAAYESDDTTHVSVVDGEGNAVSSTQTVNRLLGSGYVVPGAGFILNDEMDDFAAKAGAVNSFGLVQGEKNTIRPGKRPLSSMTPTIVLDAGGEVRAVVGSPGGSRIITSVLQVVSNLVDFHMDPAQAVAAPRIHHQWLPDQVWVDEGVSARVQHELASRGHTLRVGQKTLGNVQAVVVSPDGTRIAVSDPRGTGEPAAH